MYANEIKVLTGAFNGTKKVITKQIFIYNKTSDSGKNYYHIRLPVPLDIRNHHNILIIVTSQLTEVIKIPTVVGGPKLPRFTLVVKKMFYFYLSISNSNVLIYSLYSKAQSLFCENV